MLKVNSGYFKIIAAKPDNLLNPLMFNIRGFMISVLTLLFGNILNYKIAYGVLIAIFAVAHLEELFGNLWEKSIT